LPINLELFPVFQFIFKVYTPQRIHRKDGHFWF